MIGYDDLRNFLSSSVTPFLWRNNPEFGGFAVLTAATVKNTVLWVVTPCSLEFGKRQAFQRNTWPPSSEWKSRRRKKSEKAGGKLSPACPLRMLVSCLACSSTLKMEAISSFQTSVSLRITWRYNRKDSIQQCIYRLTSENLSRSQSTVK
jgi:hypothetical protein